MKDLGKPTGNTVPWLPRLHNYYDVRSSIKFTTLKCTCSTVTSYLSLLVYVCQLRRNSVPYNGCTSEWNSSTDCMHAFVQSLCRYLSLLPAANYRHIASCVNKRLLTLPHHATASFRRSTLPPRPRQRCRCDLNTFGQLYGAN